MSENDNVGNVGLDVNIMRAIKQTVQEAINHALSVQMKTMIETIITGVVDGLSKRIECLEHENTKLQNENRTLKDALDASEQYSRRNSLRIFGIPESAKPNESTDEIVMNLCKSMGADVLIGEIDRSHRTGKPGGPQPRPILVKFVSYRARQKLYSLRRNLKTNTEHARVFINEDLTQRRAQLLFVARGLAKAKRIESAWGPFHQRSYDNLNLRPNFGD